MGQPQCLGAIICAWRSMQHKDSPIHELVEDWHSVLFEGDWSGRSLLTSNRLGRLGRPTLRTGRLLLKGEFGWRCTRGRDGGGRWWKGRRGQGTGQCRCGVEEGEECALPVCGGGRGGLRGGVAVAVGQAIYRLIGHTRQKY